MLFVKELFAFFRSFFNSCFVFSIKGDRFIPNRSLMDLDQAHGVLTNKNSKGLCKNKPGVGFFSSSFSFFNHVAIEG